MPPGSKTARQQYEQRALGPANRAQRLLALTATVKVPFTTEDRFIPFRILRHVVCR
jgi:hypothetical protein